jgi:hypothetical protein
VVEEVDVCDEFSSHFSQQFGNDACLGHVSFMTDTGIEKQHVHGF